MPNLNKRIFIKQLTTLFATVASINISKVMANWPSELFLGKNNSKVIDSITNGSDISESELIEIKAPEIAENGAVVPITVSTELTNVKRISILVENNPSPLISSIEINDQLSPYVSTRVKMAKTSNIIAIVSTDSGHFSATKNVKVTIGGCGG